MAMSGYKDSFASFDQICLISWKRKSSLPICVHFCANGKSVGKDISVGKVSWFESLYEVKSSTYANAVQLEDTEGKHHDDDNCGKCGFRSEYHFHKMKNNVDLKGSPPTPRG